MPLPEQDFSVVPKESVDEAWERLEAQFELSGGFWLGFVFSAAPQAVARLREKRNALFEAKGLKWLDYHPADPGSLSHVLIWLLTLTETAEVDCVWVEAIRADAPGAPEQPWTRAWEQLFLRTNEHRDALRARLRGGLVFAAPPSIMPLVREAAPDLWSVRSIVINVEMAPSLQVPDPTPSLLLPRVHATRQIARPSVTPGVTTSLRLPSSALPRLARPPASSGTTRHAFTHADRRRIEALIAAGTPIAAEASILHTLEALGPDEVIDKAFAYCLLARAREAIGEFAAALRSIEEAIAIHAQATPDYVPIDWYDLARAIAWKKGDPRRALMHSLSAITESRHRARAKEGIETLRDLVFALKSHGEHGRNVDDMALALEAFDEAVLVSRRLVDLGNEDPSDLFRLSESLLNLGDARTHRNDFAGAVATFEEAVKVNRKIRMLVGDTVPALQSLSVSLNRLGRLRQDTGDLEGAGLAFEEALGIRRRVFKENDPSSLRDLASVVSKIGLLRFAMDDFGGAVTALQESRSLARQLKHLLPDSADATYNVAFILHHLGRAQEKQGNRYDAKLAYEEAVALARELMLLPTPSANIRLLLENAEKALAALPP